MRLIISASFADSSRIAADMYIDVIRKKQDALIGCSTGGSTIGIYKYLIEDYKNGKVDFSHISTVNVDEYVGLGRRHNQSFAYFMDTNFFTHVNISMNSIFLVDGAKVVEEEVSRFNQFLEDNTIDILMLGVGSNGHIGFNEPEEKLTASAHVVDLHPDTIKGNSRFFESIDEVPRKAITMGMCGITNAKKVVLIASGAAKADAIKRLLQDDYIDPRLPCSILKLCRDATVVIDKELYKLTK